MSKYIIVPYVKVGRIEFGMDREKVRTIEGGFKEFKKTKFSSNTTDDFGFCHVFYDKNNRCEAIEMFPESKVILEEIDLISLSFPELRRKLTEYDKKIEETEDSLISKKAGISITISDGRVESILAFSHGYFS